jgi:hypothetical protein
MRFMPGAPTLDELLLMGGLLVGGGLLLIIGWRLLAGYARARWDGPYEPSHWRLLSATVSALAGVFLLWLLWNALEHIAARMSVTVLVLGVLLFSEVPRQKRSRR